MKRQIVQDQIVKQVHQNNSLMVFLQHLLYIAISIRTTPQIADPILETKCGMFKAKTLCLILIRIPVKCFSKLELLLSYSPRAIRLNQVSKNAST